MKKIIAILALVLAGCSSTSVIRVVDYEGTVVSVAAKGCAVHQKGKEHSFANVIINYNNGPCSVLINNVQN